MTEKCIELSKLVIKDGAVQINSMINETANIKTTLNNVLKKLALQKHAQNL